MLHEASDERDMEQESIDPNSLKQAAMYGRVFRRICGPQRSQTCCTVSQVDILAHISARYVYVAHVAHIATAWDESASLPARRGCVNPEGHICHACVP